MPRDVDYFHPVRNFMSKKAERRTPSNSNRPAPKSDTTPNAPSQGEAEYESALKPLLWLAVPFILVLLYGLLA